MQLHIWILMLRPYHVNNEKNNYKRGQKSKVSLRVAKNINIVIRYYQPPD